MATMMPMTVSRLVGVECVIGSSKSAESFEDEIVERSSDLRCGICHNRMTRSQLLSLRACWVRGRYLVSMALALAWRANARLTAYVWQLPQHQSEPRVRKSPCSRWA